MLEINKEQYLKLNAINKIRILKYITLGIVKFKGEWLQMSNICEETRREANKKVNKKARENQILEILSDGKERIARQVAYEMWQRGFTNTAERNNASPRLTSLLEQRKVIVVGKVLDKITGKKVAVYKIAE